MYAVKKLMYYIYKRTTLTAMGVRRLRLRAYLVYSYGRFMLRLGRLCLRLRMGELQVYYGCAAAGCKPTSGH